MSVSRWAKAQIEGITLASSQSQFSQDSLALGSVDSTLLASLSSWVSKRPYKVWEKFVVLQSLSHVWLFGTPSTIAPHASLSFSICRSLLPELANSWREESVHQKAAFHQPFLNPFSKQNKGSISCLSFIFCNSAYFNFTFYFRFPTYRCKKHTHKLHH